MSRRCGQPDEYAARALIYLGGLADDLDDGDEALDFVRASISAAAPFGADLQVSAAIGMGCVLAERADPDAARYAADAIALCRRGGSAEQLAATLPTAAMICWQVGDLDHGARRTSPRPSRCWPGTRRIARVVLLSAAAGVALADGDPGAAVELGGNAARDASRPRHRPGAARWSGPSWPVRCWSRAIWRQRPGRQPRRSPRRAALPFRFPLAVPLETAALILLAGDGPAGDDRASGGQPGAEAAALLAGAAAIRDRGARPGPPALRAAVGQATGRLAGPAAVPAPQDAAARALAALAEVARRAQQADARSAPGALPRRNPRHRD